jgi:hypothetical protein
MNEGNQLVGLKHQAWILIRLESEGQTMRDQHFMRDWAENHEEFGRGVDSILTRLIARIKKGSSLGCTTPDAQIEVMETEQPSAPHHK